MSIEDRMTIDERRKYLRKMQERYLEPGPPSNLGAGVLKYNVRTPGLPLP